ncbi:hypothetical protein MKW98_011168, partial [Papaver atlanticum]
GRWLILSIAGDCNCSSTDLEIIKDACCTTKETTETTRRIQRIYLTSGTCCSYKWISTPNVISAAINSK